jgi:hypothetical protein
MDCNEAPGAGVSRPGTGNEQGEIGICGRRKSFSHFKIAEASTALPVYRSNGLTVYRTNGLPVYGSTGLPVYRSLGWGSYGRGGCPVLHQ